MTRRNHILNTIFTNIVIFNCGCICFWGKHLWKLIIIGILKANNQGALEMLLNERDNTGCSPLHYASRGGHIRSLESLIRLGACVNIKNHCGESPLHFGARYGRYNIVKRLLNSEKGAFIINESDGEGLTPLHIASQQGKLIYFQ